MTQDEIYKLCEGQDLDLLISKTVFGHTVEEWNNLFWRGRTQYSTDISAAISLLEKFGYYEIKRFGPRYAVYVETDGEGFGSSQENSLPLAACRAALFAFYHVQDICNIEDVP